MVFRNLFSFVRYLQQQQSTISMSMQRKKKFSQNSNTTHFLLSESIIKRYEDARNLRPVILFSDDKLTKSFDKNFKNVELRNTVKEFQTSEKNLRVMYGFQNIKHRGDLN